MPHEDIEGEWERFGDCVVLFCHDTYDPPPGWSIYPHFRSSHCHPLHVAYDGNKVEICLVKTEKADGLRKDWKPVATSCSGFERAYWRTKR